MELRTFKIIYNSNPKQGSKKPNKIVLKKETIAK